MPTKLQKEVAGMSAAQKKALMMTGSLGLARTAPAKLPKKCKQSRRKNWFQKNNIRTTRSQKFN
jgi:hypothetical protein